MVMEATKLDLTPEVRGDEMFSHGFCGAQRKIKGRALARPA